MNRLKKTRLVAISNRLPVSLSRKGDVWSVEPGSGGLVTAMAPVLRDRGGLWIGWPGTSEQVDFDTVLGDASLATGYDLIPVEMDEEEVTSYYKGFSNQIIWPLFHDMQSHCTFDPEFWYSYIQVNAKFADRILNHTTDEDYIWVHDYHLFHVGKFLRERGRSYRIGFFLHIPFPPMDIFVRLPWRMEILEALMEYDLVGFQTFRDRKNFLDCLQRSYPDARVTGRGTVIQVALEDRVVRVGYFPISIDYRNFVESTNSDGDHTERMESWARVRVVQLENESLCGFIFKSGSPSCGVGSGIFARIFMEHFPLLPVEEEGRLHDMKLLENFIERVFILNSRPCP